MASILPWYLPCCCAICVVEMRYLYTLSFCLICHYNYEIYFGCDVHLTHHYNIMMYNININSAIVGYLLIVIGLLYIFGMLPITSIILQCLCQINLPNKLDVISWLQCWLSCPLCSLVAPFVFWLLAVEQYFIKGGK